MATLVHATEPVDQPTWEIQREAFAPPPTRRIIRGWDRAPVPARAPRLRGHKVWKKVGLKAASIEDTQDEAQEELEKEGAGARKKSRMLTARENINDAMWAQAIPDGCVNDMGSILDHSGEQSENFNISAAPPADSSMAEVKIPLSHRDDTPNAEKQDQVTAILQFIPRKRTNTDHVITPKKPLRQTTLDHEETTRPRKSLRKSMIATISDDTSDLETSNSQIRHSSNAKHLSSSEDATSGSRGPETPVGEQTSKRRTLRRSTVTRRSIAPVEQPLDIEHVGSQSGELSPQDATKSIVSLPANSTTSGGVVTSNRFNEIPVIDNTILCDIPSLDLTLPSGAPNECGKSLGIPTHVPTSTTNSQVVNAVDVKRPEIPVNGGEDIVQIQVESIEVNIPNSMESTQDQSADGLESQNISSEFQHSAISSKAEELLMESRDTSNADGVVVMAVGASLTGDVALLIPAGNTSSLESRGDVPRTKSNISSEATTELDIHQHIQNVDTFDIPDSSSLAMSYDHDDTDMLRNFLTRVKANKAAKNPPKRKRSLPHSPLRIPLGDLDNNTSPSPLQLQKLKELDVAEPSPSKRKRKPSPLAHCENEPEPRRSGRTRPPVKEPPGAPSFIPVRRLGQDIDATVTLKRNEEKELAALTRVNTRKNKGNALTALEVLAKKSEEKEDPIMRQRLLKEVFDEKIEKGRQDKEKKGREKKTVTWAEELAQFQMLTKGKPGEETDAKEKEKVVVAHSGEDKKQGAMRVGVRSKAALGMALNGTPAPKRKMRGRV